MAIPRPTILPRPLQHRLSSVYNNPGKLAMLSHHKLQEEHSAHEPDLRRCLGHNAVLSSTMYAARRDLNRYRKSFRFSEEDGYEKSHGGGEKRKKYEEDTPVSYVREQIGKALKAMVKRRALPATTTTSTTAANNATVTTNISNKNTTTKPENKSIRILTTEHTPSNEDHTPAPPRPASPTKNLIAMKGRQCLASARNFWAQSLLLQTSVG